MGKAKRKKLLAADRKAIAELRGRGSAAALPFEAEPDDHCESSPTAYTGARLDPTRRAGLRSDLNRSVLSHPARGFADAAPLLRLLAARVGKTAAELSIYDPYYCAGAAKNHLARLGLCGRAPPPWPPWNPVTLLPPPPPPRAAASHGCITPHCRVSALAALRLADACAVLQHPGPQPGGRFLCRAGSGRGPGSLSATTSATTTLHPPPSTTTTHHHYLPGRVAHISKVWLIHRRSTTWW